MSPSVIALLIFLAAVAATGAILLGMQDLRAARASSRDPGAAPGIVRLQRVRRSGPAGTGVGPVAAFDRWFVRVVRETGLSWSPHAAALLLVLCGVLGAATLFLWNDEPLPAAFGALLGIPLPLAYLLFKRQQRIKRLQDQLPPALELLARSVRAGETLDQAMALLGRHLSEPLAAEFRWCARQLEMGLGMPAVMRSLVERVQLYDVRIFATTLIVHRQSGGNIAAVLDRLAHVIRDRLGYRRQLRVATAAGRISVGLVGLIAPAVFLFFFFFRPEYISSMLQSPLGQSMLIFAVFLEIVGLVWIARLLKPAY